jgi:hypothetical protein
MVAPAMLAGLVSCSSSESGPGPSGPAAAVPQAVRAAIAGNTVTLTWDEVEGATGYRVYMAEVGGVTRVNVGSLIGNMTHAHSHTHFDHPAGLAPSSKYSFVVTAINALGESLESCEVTARISANETSSC